MNFIDICGFKNQRKAVIHDDTREKKKVVDVVGATRSAVSVIRVKCVNFIGIWGFIDSRKAVVIYFQVLDQRQKCGNSLGGWKHSGCMYESA